MYKIMVVEDDEKIQSLIKDKLERYGYTPIIVKDFSRVKESFMEENPNLVLLDINLPNYDGFFWCRELRSISKVPIIFVSARFSDMDQVLAIENGGDDYIIKPFSFELLLAKIKGVIRRTYGEYAENKNKDMIEVDGLFLYKNQNIIEYNGQKVELTKNEFILLNSLILNMEDIVLREKLLEDIWDDIEFVDDNTLSVNIGRLRKKLESIGILNAIETKRGQGYSMVRSWRYVDEI